jgi:outer membrane biosynthesis protein TonB
LKKIEEMPSKYRALNRAVNDILERAKPLPVFPEDLPGDEISLSIPVAFKLQVRGVSDAFCAVGF